MKKKKRKLLANPPIEEAIISIHFPEIDIQRIKEITANLPTSLINKYPERKEIKRHQFSSKIETNKSPKVKTKSELRGIHFVNDKEKKVIRFDVDGFHFSKLRPYKSWQDTLTEALEVWNAFNKNNNFSVLNLSVRNVNIIKIPYVSFEFRDYFKNPPESTNKVSAQIVSFFHKIVLYYPKKKVLSFTTLTNELSQNTNKNQTSLIFDIRVSTEKNNEGLVKTNLEKLLTELNDIKDNIFFGSITRKMKRSFE